MPNPLESEEAAFRFVLGTILYFVPIVVAAWIATWLGVIVFVAMSALAFAALRRRTTPLPQAVSTERAAVEDTRRILVVTDTTPVGERLQEAIRRVAGGVSEDVLLVCAVARSPAVPGASEGPGPIVAQELETALQELRAAGISARGTVVVGEPLSALEDALAGFDADEVVVSISLERPPSPSSSEDVVGAVRPLFDGPVTVIVEDTVR